MIEFPILVLAVTEPVTLFRGCQGADAELLTAAMRSNYDEGRNPHPDEQLAVAVYMSVSMFEDPGPIERFGRRRPDRVGRYVARVELRPGQGFCRADTGGLGHWSVWGLPRQLAACVRDVSPIE